MSSTVLYQCLDFSRVNMVLFFFKGHFFYWWRNLKTKEKEVKFYFRSSTAPANIEILQKSLFSFRIPRRNKIPGSRSLLTHAWVGTRKATTLVTSMSPREACERNNTALRTSSAHSHELWCLLSMAKSEIASAFASGTVSLFSSASDFSSGKFTAFFFIVAVLVR